jgi:hypothetical protein
MVIRVEQGKGGKDRYVMLSAQESWAAAELTHEQPQREIWLRLALMWALAALRSREEAEALG